MYNIVFPCMMMSTLTVLVFCLPPDSGEKIALGVTVLLAFSVFMLAIAEKMPETSESIPLIGKTKVPKQKGWKLLPKIPFLQYNKNETFWEIFKHCAQVYLSFLKKSPIKGKKTTKMCWFNAHWYTIDLLFPFLFHPFSLKSYDQMREPKLNIESYFRFYCHARRRAIACIRDKIYWLIFLEKSLEILIFHLFRYLWTILNLFQGST